ncbi:elongation factor G [Microbacter sp. GSS18]|nr:elongation factor G [Microbacter sp. GSS18]
MAARETSVRTIALIGAAGSGKTTLLEAILHRAGAISRPGSVDRGSTVSDHEPEEIARGHSLNLSLAAFEWTTDDGVHALTVADTPGHPDFGGAVDAALAVADVGLLVLNSFDGVVAGTRTAAAAAESAQVPLIAVVTQEDRARADFRTVVAGLRELLGDVVWPIELPLGEEHAFHGVADILTERALEDDGSGGHISGELPAEVQGEEHDAHVAVVEEIVSHDDAQLEEYLEGREPTAADLARTFADEVAAREAVPVVVCSGVTGTGVERLLDLVCTLAPSAQTHDSRIVLGADGPGTRVDVACDPGGETLVHAFRTIADPFVGQVSMLKVLSGALHPNDRLRNATTGVEERLTGLFRLRGADHVPAESLRAGDVGAVAKLTGTPSGSLLWTRSTGAARPLPLPERQPLFAVSVEPVSQADDAKLSTALARLVSEDPTLVVDRSGGATVLRGLGEAHVEVAVQRMARVLGVHVTTGPAPIAYRERIMRPATAEGKVKKQSGGHGQFALVQLAVSPLPANAGYEFANSVVGGAVPKAYVAAVEKGALEALQAGGPHGHPVVDARVELLDGKAHSVDSSDMAFRVAASLAVTSALTEAGTVVLEPVSIVVVTVPTELQGAVLTDLSGRRGRVSATETIDDRLVRLTAAVPDAELTRYVLDLRSLTAGRGQVAITPDRYEPVPHGGAGAR